MVELMTVVAILVLSLVLVAPYIGQFLDERKVRNVAESLEYGMLKAKSEAASTNAKTRFVWSDGAGWAVSLLDMTVDPPTLVTPPVETFDWGGRDANWSSVSVIAVWNSGGTSTTATSATVTFYSMGDVVFPDPSVAPPQPQPPNWFDVCGLSGSRKLRVTVVDEGGIKVCDPEFLQTDPKGCKGSASAAKPVSWNC
jgi:type IV fimbrial biogenesis protein FimT